MDSSNVIMRLKKRFLPEEKKKEKKLRKRLLEI